MGGVACVMESRRLSEWVGDFGGVVWLFAEAVGAAQAPRA